jgi:AcrR family transcriptional regulator
MAATTTETPEKVNLKVEQGRQTRRRLLDAARTVFGEQGYEHVSAEQLVAAAGVTRGALYHHFDDKKDVFRTVVIELEHELDHRIRVAAEGATDSWGLMEAGVRAALESCLEPDIARIVMLDGPAVLGWDGWDEVDADFGIAQVTLGLQMLQSDGIVAPQPVEPLARMVVALMNGACRTVAQSDHPAAAVDGVYDAVMTLLRGLRIDQ